TRACCFLGLTGPLASSQLLQAFSRLFVHAISELRSSRVLVPWLLEVFHEGSRAALLYLLPRRAADRGVRRDEADRLASAVLGGETFEQRVGVLGEANLERAVRSLFADAVEDDHAASALQGDEAGEPVDELARVLERPRVQQVVAVEQVERRLSHAAGAWPRRAAARPRR